MIVNVSAKQWKDAFKRLTLLLVVLVVLFSSFAQAEKEPVEADGAKSDNPPSVVS
jgi:hypothetical protein